jgi:hypothetical protein
LFLFYSLTWKKLKNIWLERATQLALGSVVSHYFFFSIQSSWGIEYILALYLLGLSLIHHFSYFKKYIKTEAVIFTSCLYLFMYSQVALYWGQTVVSGAYIAAAVTFIVTLLSYFFQKNLSLRIILINTISIIISLCLFKLSLIPTYPISFKKVELSYTSIHSGQKLRKIIYNYQVQELNVSDLNQLDLEFFAYVPKDYIDVIEVQWVSIGDEKVIDAFSTKLQYGNGVTSIRFTKKQFKAGNYKYRIKFIDSRVLDIIFFKIKFE